MRDALGSVGGRRLAWWTLALGVTVVHLWVAQSISQLTQDAWLGEGAGDSVKRMDVAFVRELAPTAPLAPSAKPVRPALQANAAMTPSPAASSPQTPAVIEPPQRPDQPDDSVNALKEAASPPWSQASAPDAPASAVATPTTTTTPATTHAAFEWPPSTRLTYSLTGYYRGPVEGGAAVQWMRQGQRYQVHLDVFIGPSFAPLLQRRMTSDGEVTDQGLRPLQYEEQTQVSFFAPRRVSVRFEPQRVVLAGGKEVATLPGIQDTASQFVQMTWLFTTQPQRLSVGQMVEVPLALPRRVDRWIYDITAEEPIKTPAGSIPTFYVKPRRENQSSNDLAVEAWFAPSLQYLPVRIRIRQDEDTWVDLVMDKLPQQARESR